MTLTSFVMTPCGLFILILTNLHKFLVFQNYQVQVNVGLGILKAQNSQEVIVLKSGFPTFDFINYAATGREIY